MRICRKLHRVPISRASRGRSEPGRQGGGGAHQQASLPLAGASQEAADFTANFPPGVPVLRCDMESPQTAVVCFRRLCIGLDTLHS